MDKRDEDIIANDMVGQKVSPVPISASTVVSSKGPTSQTREHEKRILESILPPDLRHLVRGGSPGTIQVVFQPLTVFIFGSDEEACLNFGSKQWNTFNLTASISLVSMLMTTFKSKKN